MLVWTGRWDLDCHLPESSLDKGTCVRGLGPCLPCRNTYGAAHGMQNRRSENRIVSIRSCGTGLTHTHLIVHLRRAPRPLEEKLPLLLVATKVLQVT